MYKYRASCPLKFAIVFSKSAMVSDTIIRQTTTGTVLRLILGGGLERHPRLNIVQPHAGGVLPYLMGRIEEQTEVKRRGCQRLTRPPGEYYRQFYLDVVSSSALAMRYVYDFADHDRLLFGSDQP